MGIIVTPESELGKELAKHEQFPSKYTGDLAPGNPYQFRQYPRMLYMAFKRNGQNRCMDTDPDLYLFQTTQAYERAILEISRFNSQCQIIAKSESEYENYRSRGWRDTPQEAVAYQTALDEEVSTAAAETAFGAQRMSRQAKAELEAADASTDKHVTDLAGTPRSRRGSDAKKKSDAKSGKKAVAES